MLTVNKLFPAGRGLALQELGDETDPLGHRYLLELSKQLALAGDPAAVTGQHHHLSLHGVY